MDDNFVNYAHIWKFINKLPTDQVVLYTIKKVLADFAVQYVTDDAIAKL